MYQKPKVKKTVSPMEQAIMDRMQKVAQYRPAGSRPVPQQPRPEPAPGQMVPDFEPAQAPQMTEGLSNNPEFLAFQKALFELMNKGKK